MFLGVECPYGDREGSVMSGKFYVYEHWRPDTGEMSKRQREVWQQRKAVSMTAVLPLFEEEE
jgi:hypothetical protein